MAPAASDVQPFDVLIIGLGAVGCLYAYSLQRSGKVRVTGVARSNAASIAEHGVSVQSAKFGNDHFRLHRVVSSIDQALDRQYRFVLVTTKALPDISPTSVLIAPLFANGTGPTICLLQNGIGIEEPVAEAFPKAEILSAILWIGANLVDGGRKLTHGTLDRIVLGLYTGEEIRASSSAESEDPKVMAGLESAALLGSLLKAGGSEVEDVTPEKLQQQRWAKNLWNISLSTFCALTRTPVSNILTEEVVGHTLPVVRRVMLELCHLARACGLTEAMLPLSLIDTTLSMTYKTYAPEHTRSPNFKPSMLLDMEAGRPIELEPIVGSVIDRARRVGLETPRLDMIYALLVVYQSRFRPTLPSSEDDIATGPRSAPRKPGAHATTGANPGSGSNTPTRRRSLVAGARMTGLSEMSAPTIPSPLPLLDAVSPTRKKDKALGRPVGLNYAKPSAS